MSKTLRQVSWIAVIATVMISGYSMRSSASPAPALATEAAGELVPQATCAQIKCKPGEICINALECTPAGDCFHVGHCTTLP